MLSIEGSNFFLATTRESPSGRCETLLVESVLWFDARRVARAFLDAEAYVSKAISREIFPKLREAVRVQAKWVGRGASAKLYTRRLSRRSAGGKLAVGPWEVLS
jgi:hypothetical protein